MLRLSQALSDASHALSVLGTHPAAARVVGATMNVHAMQWCEALTRGVPSPPPVVPVFTAVARKRTLSPLAVERTGATKAVWSAARAVVPGMVPAGVVIAVMVNAGILASTRREVREDLRAHLLACMAKLQLEERGEWGTLTPAQVSKAHYLASKSCRFQLPATAQAYAKGKVCLPFPPLGWVPTRGDEFTVSTAALRRRFARPQATKWNARARQRKAARESSMSGVFGGGSVVDLW